jgi:hypothetical protein
VGVGLGLGLGFGFSASTFSHLTLLIFWSQAVGRVFMVIFLAAALRQRGAAVVGHVKSLWWYMSARLLSHVLLRKASAAVRSERELAVGEAKGWTCTYV